jgi:hypothetical protein
MAKNRVRAYPVPPQAALDAAARAMAKVPKASSITSDPTTGVVTAKVGVSFKSWGENLRVQVGAHPPAGAAVSCTAELKMGLVDWGKCKKDLADFFLALDAEIGHPGTDVAAVS